MILSDADIERALKTGRIVIDPAPDLALQLGPCSIDLRLGYEFVVGDDRRTLGPGDTQVLLPRGFVLGATLEAVTLPDDLAGRLEGRSSLARQGIIVHGTAGLIAPGAHGVIVLEFANLGPKAVVLRPGERICALAFEPLTTPSARPYRGQYHGQLAP
ncbi:MAG TPA: dCTP deaminase [Dehalococcoidia bacterium]|nr:dCTP deaminase [Dehalococcoidia bacterium]